MKTIKSSFIIFVVAVSSYFLFIKKQTKLLDKTLTAESITTEKADTIKADQTMVSTEATLNTATTKIDPANESSANQADDSKRAKPLANSEKPQSLKNDESEDAKQTLTYTIDDGLIVIQGDIVIGAVSPDTLLTRFSGPVEEPSIKLWPITKIPYYIQPNLRNPERVLQALKYFSNTNIQFVPYANQEDVIVFEQGQNACKSYLGHIGGRQPLWISEGCSARNIAHELMHSLGFIHGQNRDDRDSYINVFWENINPKFEINFEKFSSSSMRVTGLSQFDFESIMIYSELTFSVNGLPTIKSKINDQVVFPSQVLTAKDVERLNKAYAQ